MAWTKKELIGKLQGFPQRHEARLRECARRAVELVDSKGAIIRGAGAQSFAAPGPRAAISDPTGDEAVGLAHKYTASYSALVRQMNALLDDMEMIDNALQWLMMHDPSGGLCEIVRRKYIMAQGWGKVGSQVIYARETLTRKGNEAIRLMLAWINSWGIKKEGG